MPRFELNTGNAARGYDSLSHFQKSYVEAMFFTNGDIGDDDEFKLNRLGVERLPRASLETIKADCDKFLAMEVDGRKVSDWIDLAESEGATGNAAHDLWFTRQGHGCGFLEDSDWPGPAGEALNKAASAMGESYVETWRGWIYVR